jgi:hypothetical protein
VGKNVFSGEVVAQPQRNVFRRHGLDHSKKTTRINRQSRRHFKVIYECGPARSPPADCLSNDIEDVPHYCRFRASTPAACAKQSGIDPLHALRGSERKTPSFVLDFSQMSKNHFAATQETIAVWYQSTLFTDSMFELSVNASPPLMCGQFGTRPR